MYYIKTLCTVLKHCVLYWNAVCCVETLCTILKRCVLCWNTLHYIETLCTVLKQCTILKRCVLCWNTVHYIETLCTVLKHCALYWNAVHCAETLCTILKRCVLCWNTVPNIRDFRRCIAPTVTPYLPPCKLRTNKALQKQGIRQNSLQCAVATNNGSSQILVRTANSSCCNSFWETETKNVRGLHTLQHLL
jgi:hypothetical protein